MPMTDSSHFVSCAINIQFLALSLHYPSPYLLQGSAHALVDNEQEPPVWSPVEDRHTSLCKPLSSTGEVTQQS